MLKQKNAAKKELEAEEKLISDENDKKMAEKLEALKLQMAEQEKE
jgi:hypothetical protein